MLAASIPAHVQSYVALAEFHNMLYSYSVRYGSDLFRPVVL